MITSSVFVSLLSCSISFSQSVPAKPLAFDVVSIRPNHTGSPAMVNRTTPDGYSFENVFLRIILSDAFGIRADLISGGPSWLDSEHYDLIAKIAGEDLPVYEKLSSDDRDRLLQAVLAERCHLVTHTEVRQSAGYSLIVAKSGPKLTEAAPKEVSGWGANFGDIRATATSISTLADLLSQQMQQSVVDNTRLTGRYTFHLHWAEERPGAAAPPSDTASEPSGEPALPTALEEQLGLKLTAQKLPTTTLVIDHIDRPSPN